MLSFIIYPPFPFTEEEGPEAWVEQSGHTYSHYSRNLGIGAPMEIFVTDDAVDQPTITAALEAAPKRVVFEDDPKFEDARAGKVVLDVPEK